jgi:formylglycine-generating enzyme
LEPVYVLPQQFENHVRWTKSIKWNRQANGYRLVTEAEWEYAARAGEYTLYSGSDDVDEVAWYKNNSEDIIHPIGQKKSNRWGL